MGLILEKVLVLNLNLNHSDYMGLEKNPHSVPRSQAKSPNYINELYGQFDLEPLYNLSWVNHISEDFDFFSERQTPIDREP